MKYKLLTLLLTTQILNAQKSNDDLLEDLKNQFQYMKMDSVNELNKGKNYSFYKSVYQNVINNPEESLKLLTKKNNKHLKNTYQYVKLINDNASKLFDYKSAYESSLAITTNFKDKLTEKELEDEINNLRIWEVLKNKPKQTISTYTEEIIQTKRDIAGLLTLEVINKDYKSDYVFDTGAGLNCITTTEAQKLGIEILPDNNIEIQSFTGQLNKVRIGIAKSLNIGNITIKNAVFLVYPDSAFSFAGGQYKINGIFGFPIAKDLGTLTFEDNSINIKKGGKKTNNPKNFFIDHLRPIIMVKYKGKTLPNNFDSGASSSLFNKKFYETYKDYIDQNATSEISKHAGAGAEIYEDEVKLLSDETIIIGDKKVKLSEMKIDPINYGVFGKENYGNIGQDVLKQFRKVTMSFEENYLLLEN